LPTRLRSPSYGAAGRQFVFTTPKRFRAFFRFDRKLFKRLPRLAWETARDVYRAVLARDDVVPGMIGAPQSFGDLINWHPHIHALISDGAFASDGQFPKRRGRQVVRHREEMLRNISRVNMLQERYF
jgi:hypothetical protein